MTVPLPDNFSVVSQQGGIQLPPGFSMEKQIPLPLGFSLVAPHQPKPASPGAISNFLNKSIAQPFRSIMAGVTKGQRDIFKNLDAFSVYLEDKFGIPRGGAFEDLSKLWDRWAKEHEAKGIAPDAKGFVNEATRAIYEGGGRLATDLPIISTMGLTTYMAAMGAGESIQLGESPAIGALKGGAQGALLHGSLKGLAVLPRAPAMAGGAAVFGVPSGVSEAQLSAEQREWGRVAGDAMLGAGLMALGQKPTQEQFRAMRLAAKRPVEVPEKPAETVRPEIRPGVPVEVAKGIEAKARTFKFEDAEIETRFQGAEGVRKESLSESIQSKATTFRNKATREFEHLPHTKEFSQLRFDLLRLRKQHGVSGDKTVRFVDSITKPLDKPSYDLFRRKVILEDFNEVAKEGMGLPFGFDVKSVASELSRINEAMTPLVSQQFAKRTAMWDQLRSDYTTAMKDIGFDVEGRLTRPNYFRHQVLEHAEAKSYLGTGKRVKTPTGRGFLRRRKGSELDINTDYIQAEYEVISQMLYDIETANVLKGVMKRGEDIAPRLKAAARKEKIEDWHDLIPEGYVAWQPREGHVFYMTESISQRIAQQLTEGNLVKILPGETRTVLAMGRKRQEYVVKREIAATLDNFGTARSDNILIGGSRKMLRAWKVWQLLSPRRFAKYNFRNLTGDAEAAWLGNPSGFRYAPRAARELYDVMVRNKEMTPEFKGWFERGGIQSTLQALEMGELNKMGRFIRLQEVKGKPGEIPLKAWQKYWGAVRVSTDIREATLRYANYLDYLDQMKAGKGKPKNFGASIPEEVLGLRDIKDRAYTLSNDLLGAYDKVGVVGQHLREQMIPFWSWKEVNFRRYIQFTKNAIEDGHLPQLVGRKLVGGITKSPYKIYRVGKFAIKATAFWSALQVWNHLKFPELEASLSEQEQNTPHIIFGTDKDGNIMSFNRMGTLGDFLEWFGLDAAPAHLSDFMSGKKTIREIAIEMAKSPVNVVAQGLTPVIKLPAELVTRQALFPDVFEPRVIRDRGFHIARSFGLENEYKAAQGLPSRPYKESVPGFFIYKTDPLQSAYNKIRNDVARYKKKIGKGSEGYWLTPRGDALYNIKLALRYGDGKAADEYLTEYVRLGGNPDNVLEALMNLNPLEALSEDDQLMFLGTLNEEGKKNLAKAFLFWDQITSGGVQP